MTSTTSVEWSITQISLSNILESCLMPLAEEIAAWRAVRSDAVGYREIERQEGIRAFDKSAFDYYNEYVALNDGRAVAFELLLDLYVAVGGNPFPEQKMRLLEVATLLFPEISVGFTPKTMFHGRAAWRDIFQQFELPASFEIAFPVATPVDIVAVEQKLIDLACGDSSVPVEVAMGVMAWSTSSQAYRKVKKGLEERGWVWGIARVGGAVKKVILLPKV
jgi:hypothetical protein